MKAAVIATIIIGVGNVMFLLAAAWPTLRRKYREWRWRAVTRANLAQLRRNRL